NFMYQQDYGKAVPRNAETTIWMTTLRNYNAGVRAIRLCPMAKEPQASWKAGTSENCWWWERQMPMEEWTGSYAMNGWFYTEKMNTYYPQNRFQSEASVQNT